jgi:hypothetical protein
MLEYLSSVVFVVQSCITNYGCPHEDIMKDMMVWANQIRMLPGKLGRLGEDFFHLLMNEIKIFGAGFRARLRIDFPCLADRTLKCSKK